MKIVKTRKTDDEVKAMASFVATFTRPTSTCRHALAACATAASEPRCTGAGSTSWLKFGVEC